MRGIVAALLIVCCATAQAQEAAEPQATDATEPHIIDFGVDTNERMTVPVRIGSEGPFAFIVDTGSTGTVIAKELAEQLQLRSGPTTRIHSLSNAQLVPTAMLPSLQATGRTLKATKAMMLAHEHIGAAGILGLDALKSQHVVIDFGADTMAVSPASATAPEIWDANQIVVTARSRLGQLVIADADVDGERVYVIIDTGGQISVGNEALRRKLFGSKTPRVWEEIHLLSVTGGTTPVNYTRVDRLRIAGLRMSGVPIAFGDAHPFRTLDLMKEPAVMLGMDALRLFDRVTVDFAKKKVAFQWARGTAR